ncbi:MAG: AAA family ATPase [Limisphaerales bacterium]
MSEVILRPEELQPAAALINKTLEQLDRILLGRKELHRLVLIGILSRGHILFEGLPGLGKTALVRTIGQVLKLDFKRIQFTPDLMPGDVLGTHILQETSSGKRELAFQPGPVFTNILLADEINRASPKTQSAMLETMQENSVTLLGTTRPLPQPFFVLASQNPIELEGTYPLPEAQLDRFLFRLIFEQVDVDVLDAIISGRRRGELPAPEWQMERDQLEMLFQTMGKIYLPRPVSRYIARLVSATHPNSPGSNRTGEQICQLWCFTACGNRDCRGGAWSCAGFGATKRWLRGCESRRATSVKSSLDFKLPGALRPDDGFQTGHAVAR